MKPENIFALTEFTLVVPYSASFETLMELSRVYQMKFLCGGSDSSKASILIPASRFKMVFGKLPSVGIIATPARLAKVVNKIKVIKLINRMEK